MVARPTAALSKSSTTNQQARSSASQGIMREMYNVFDRKRQPRGNKRTAAGQTVRSFFFRIRSSAIRAFGGCLGSKRR